MRMRTERAMIASQKNATLSAVRRLARERRSLRMTIKILAYQESRNGDGNLRKA